MIVFENQHNAFMESRSPLMNNISQNAYTNRWQGKFFIHLICLFIQIKGRINFMPMGRYGSYNEAAYRANFSKSFDFQGFNRELILSKGSGHYLVAFAPSHIKKSGKHTFGRGKFWSGCDKSMKEGLD